MVEFFNRNQFIEMPWKNGGGKTLEIFRISNVEENSLTK